jgi:hypothetical protein
VVQVSDGMSRDADELRRSIERAAREVVDAHGAEVMSAGAGCDEAGAIGLAHASAAQGALIAQVQATPAGEIRGTRLAAASARVVLRLVDADGHRLHDGNGERDAYGETFTLAVAQASRAALADAARSLQSTLAQQWPSETVLGDVVPVQLTGFTRYSEYVSVVRALVAMPGVTVEPRRFIRGQADLLVHASASAAQLAARLARVPLPSLRLAVKTAGNTLQIAIVGEEVKERG